MKPTRFPNHYRPILVLLAVTAASPVMAQRGYEPNQRTAPAPTAASNSLAIIRQEISSLTTDVNQLSSDFSEHLRAQGQKPTSEEASVQEGLQALGESINGLIKESSARVSEQRILRAFHLVDYNAKDLIGQAAKAGYSKAFSKPLAEIGEHIQNLSAAGYKNPRVKLEAVGQGGLFGGGPIFRKDSDEKTMIRPGHPETGSTRPRTERDDHDRYPNAHDSRRPADPTSVPQRALPRYPEGSQPQPQEQPQRSGGGLADLLRTILGGGR